MTSTSECASLASMTWSSCSAGSEKSVRSTSSSSAAETATAARRGTRSRHRAKVAQAFRRERMAGQGGSTRDKDGVEMACCDGASREVRACQARTGRRQDEANQEGTRQPPSHRRRSGAPYALPCPELATSSTFPHRAPLESSLHGGGRWAVRAHGAPGRPWRERHSRGPTRPASCSHIHGFGHQPMGRG